MLRKTGETREEQFRINAKVVKELSKSCSMMNPHAIYCIVTNPVKTFTIVLYYFIIRLLASIIVMFNILKIVQINSTVPLFCEMFKKAGVLNEAKILGISNLGMMRASAYIAQEKVDCVHAAMTICFCHVIMCHWDKLPQILAQFCLKLKGWKASQVSCPVIGGHSGNTIIPIISQCSPDPKLTEEQVKLITHEVRVRDWSAIDEKTNITI